MFEKILKLRALKKFQQLDTRRCVSAKISMSFRGWYCSIRVFVWLWVNLSIVYIIFVHISVAVASIVFALFYCYCCCAFVDFFRHTILLGGNSCVLWLPLQVALCVWTLSRITFVFIVTSFRNCIHLYCLYVCDVKFHEWILCARAHTAMWGIVWG